MYGNITLRKSATILMQQSWPGLRAEDRHRSIDFDRRWIVRHFASVNVTHQVVEWVELGTCVTLTSDLDLPYGWPWILMLETLKHMVFWWRQTSSEGYSPVVTSRWNNHYFKFISPWHHDRGITFTWGLTSSKKPYVSRSQALKFMVNHMVDQGQKSRSHTSPTRPILLLGV